MLNQKYVTNITTYSEEGFFDFLKPDEEKKARKEWVKYIEEEAKKELGKLKLEKDYGEGVIGLDTNIIKGLVNKINPFLSKIETEFKAYKKILEGIHSEEEVTEDILNKLQKHHDKIEEIADKASLEAVKLHMLTDNKLYQDFNAEPIDDSDFYNYLEMHIDKDWIRDETTLSEYLSKENMKRVMDFFKASYLYSEIDNVYN